MRDYYSKKPCSKCYYYKTEKCWNATSWAVCVVGYQLWKEHGGANYHETLEYCKKHNLRKPYLN